VSESAEISDTANVTRITVAAIEESVTTQDLFSALAQFMVKITENTTAVDSDEAESDSDVFTRESARASDVVSCRYLWELIDDSQTADWVEINNPQSPSWAELSTTDNTSWTLINTI
jgi:hypothetical protein